MSHYRKMTHQDRKIRSGAKTATCPRCGHRRPVEKINTEWVVEAKDGFWTPTLVMKSCDYCS